MDRAVLFTTCMPWLTFGGTASNGENAQNAQNAQNTPTKMSDQGVGKMGDRERLEVNGVVFELVEENVDGEYRVVCEDENHGALKWRPFVRPNRLPTVLDWGRDESPPAIITAIAGENISCRFIDRSGKTTEIGRVVHYQPLLRDRYRWKIKPGHFTVGQMTLDPHTQLPNWPAATVTLRCQGDLALPISCRIPQ